VNLLLLPGLLCDGAAWAPIFPYVERHAECRVADYASVTSLAAMAQRVLADAPSTFALAGHSMGGRVALEILRRAPERVSKLALLDTGFQPRAEGSAGDEEQSRRFALLALARAQGMRAMAREWVRPMVHPDRLDDAPLIDAVLDMFERRTPAEFAAQIQALLARPDATALLRSIACPTLVLCGRDDGWSTLRQHEEMAALIPGATLAVIDGCGHMAPMERPSDVGTVMAGWLAEAACAEATDSRMLPLERA
jgi:pimeloyl-ACP methyl ester carboxylesterase